MFCGKVAKILGTVVVGRCSVVVVQIVRWPFRDYASVCASYSRNVTWQVMLKYIAVSSAAFPTKSRAALEG